MDAMRPYPDNFYVALPWVNNTSGNIQNEMAWDAEDREFQWAFEDNFQLQSVKLSFQPYLLHILYQICRALGYKVYFKGINEGFDDGGIDLIAYKGNEAILIQCKNWENSQIKQEQLRVFLGDCTAYIEQNQKIFAKRNVKRLFITSCKDIDYGVKKFVEQNNLEYQIIPYEK